MILSRARSFALAALLAPLLTAGALAQQAEAPQQDEAQAEDKAPAEDKAEEAKEADAEPARICRHIRTDMSSRRKTKICRTTEEWTALGNPR